MCIYLCVFCLAALSAAMCQECSTAVLQLMGLGDNWILGPGQEGMGTSTAAPVFFLAFKKQIIEFCNNEKEKRSYMLMKAKTAK